MLDDNIIDKFDNTFFYTTPLEAVAMDPQQRMLLEIAYEAVESARISLDTFLGTDTAVFAGLQEFRAILKVIDALPQGWKAASIIQSRLAILMPLLDTWLRVRLYAWRPIASDTSLICLVLLCLWTRHVHLPCQHYTRPYAPYSMATRKCPLFAAPSSSLARTCSCLSQS